MYDLNDTIVAVSSPGSDKRVILRISGACAIDAVNRVFSPAIRSREPGICEGRFVVDADLEIDALVYFFVGPKSYTGEGLAEIHFYSSSDMTSAAVSNLLKQARDNDLLLRAAQAGEFTARAYLNGKMDLTQAEAVNEIIVSSNRLQLSAAEKLLAGNLAATTRAVSGDLLDCMSLIEAGMDFSEEDIDFISPGEAFERLLESKSRLEQMLSGSVSYEQVMELSCVGIAGAANAGKSSLVNALLGRKRSIVSGQPKTTRDVLTGKLELKRSGCVLFDCAGLVIEAASIIDELAQAAATEAIGNADAVVFCVDIAEQSWVEDQAIFKKADLDDRSERVIAVATKADMIVDSGEMRNRLGRLREIFGMEFTAVSVKDAASVENLKRMIDERLVELSAGGGGKIVEANPAAVLTARHVLALTEAADNIAQAAQNIRSGDDEISAMYIRSAIESLVPIEVENIDEQVLNNIFGRFCIGK